MRRSILLLAIFIVSSCLISGCIDLKAKNPVDEKNDGRVGNSSGVGSSGADANTANALECLDLTRIDEINSKRSKVAENASEAEEYAVYDALIWPREPGSSEINSSYLMVIYGNTSPEPDSMVYTSFGTSEAKLFSEMLGLERETLEDYFAKNAQGYRLKNLFNLGVRFVIVDESEMHEIFRINPEHKWSSWEEHYERCQHSPGIYYLSRVGFNSQRNQALAQVGYDFPGMLSGRGYFVLLLKENDSWAIKDSLMTWMS